MIGFARARQAPSGARVVSHRVGRRNGRAGRSKAEVLSDEIHNADEIHDASEVELRVGTKSF
jgi:hypothetical protein